MLNNNGKTPNIWRRRATALGVVTVVAAGVQISTMSGAFAWYTQQSASSNCVTQGENAGHAAVHGVFKNTEPVSQAQNNAMVVTASSIYGTLGTKTVQPGATGYFDKVTDKSQIAAGKITFALKWVDRSGTDSRTASYEATGDCRVPVQGDVTFNEGSVSCVDNHPLYLPPTFGVAGDDDVVYDHERGIFAAHFGEDVTVNATGVAHPDKEVLTGQTTWEHRFAPKPPAPSNCYVLPVVHPKGHANCGCRHHHDAVQFVMNNRHSKNGTRHHPATVHYRWQLSGKTWVRSGTRDVRAGHVFTTRWKSVPRGTHFKLWANGHLLDKGKVSLVCRHHHAPPPITPPHTGERTATGGKVVSGKA